MQISRYGIMLENLKPEHLEMVRLWRNQDFVRSNMQFQELLCRQDQEKWFSSLNPQTNLYWVIHFNEYPIGLIHIKNIDLKNGVGEAGVFIGEPSFLEMPQPMLAILFMMELAFYLFRLKELQAKIRSGNTHAIRFNKQLGYQLEDGQPAGFQYYTVDRNQFEAATEKIRSGAQKMYGNNTSVNVVSTPEGLHKRVLLLLEKELEQFNATAVSA